MFGNHLVEIRGLMEIGRYQNKFKHVRRSVAEHLVLRAKPDYSAKLIVKPSGSMSFAALPVQKKSSMIQFLTL